MFDDLGSTGILATCITTTMAILPPMIPGVSPPPTTD
jgi:hypothetical protein